MIIGLVIYSIVHVICGVLAYGLTLANFQKALPLIAKTRYKAHVGLARLFALLGVIGLISALLCLFTEYGTDMFKHGLMYRSPHKKEKSND